jgi:hypothetical protein
MDQIVEAAGGLFLRFEPYLLGLAVFILTFFIRRIVETAIPSAKKMKDENEDGLTYTTKFAVWWNSVILYAIPVVLGSILGWMAVQYDWAEFALATTHVGGLAYGAGVGWFSSFFYKVIHKTLKAKTGIDPTPDMSLGNSLPPDSK